MNRCTRVLAVMIGSVGLMASAVEAQQLNTSITAATNAAASRGEIVAFVSGQVTALEDGTHPSAQQKARDVLIDQVRYAEAESASFLEVYAEALNDALLPLAKNSSMRVRLNAAIVAARVAGRVDNDGLKPVILDFLKDPSEAVVLWGIKGVGAILPAVMRNPLLQKPDNPLITSLMAAVKAHPAGVIYADAYDALTLNIQDPQQAKNLTVGMKRAVIEPMLNLLGQRIDEYRTKVPQDPSAEKRATLFLTDARVWNQAMNDAEKKQTFQLLRDLMWLASQHLNPSGDKAEALTGVISETSKALWVAASNSNYANLQLAVTPLNKINANAAPAQIKQWLQAVNQTMAGINALSNMPPAPTVGASTKEAASTSAAP